MNFFKFTHLFIPPFSQWKFDFYLFGTLVELFCLQLNGTEMLISILFLGLEALFTLTAERTILILPLVLSWVCSMWAYPSAVVKGEKKKKTTKKPTPQNPGVLFLITGLACLTAWKGFHLFWMPSHPSEYLGTKTILNGCEQPHRTQSLGALDRNIFQVCSPEAFSEMLAQWFRLLPPHTSKLVWVSLYDSLVQNIKKKKRF